MLKERQIGKLELRTKGLVWPQGMVEVRVPMAQVVWPVSVQSLTGFKESRKLLSPREDLGPIV